MPADVEALSLTKRLAHLSDGRTVPITNLLDAWGDDTADLAEAVAFVCGAGREWWALPLADFETRRPH